MDRVILHSDLNSFYASVECLYHPELRNKPVAVGGDPEERHGIILAKNDLAKKCGVKTGEALWEARQKCPDIVIVPPNFPLYLKFSKMARNIYADYTDKVEPYGIDECWLDVTGCQKRGVEIAEEIRHRIKFEMGVTVSIGVSFNKIFAKLGSDMKKPDAITVISKENFKDKVWSLPASDLLYVGKSTTAKFNYYGIYTIGDIAERRVDFLKSFLGKMGECIWAFANGLDDAPVAYDGDIAPCKSIGNSTTCYRDLENENDVAIVFNALSESVAMRLREQGFKASVVSISVRDKNLIHYTRQCKITQPINCANDIANYAIKLFNKSYDWHSSVRSIGVSCSDLTGDNVPIQFDLFTDNIKKLKREQLDKTIDKLRNRFGFDSIKRAVVLQDLTFSKLNAKDDHTIHPYNYF